MFGKSKKEVLISVIALCICAAFVFLATSVVPNPYSTAQEAENRGDINADGQVNIADAIYLLNYLFAHGPPPPGKPSIYPPRVIYLVRHAEKGTGQDPGLTPEGQQRAQRLAEVLKNTNLKAVYASKKRRTIETALPTAQDHGLELKVLDQEDPQELNTLLDSLKALPSGSEALVVGHSYTLDDILKGLGVKDPPRISTSIYDYFFILLLPTDQDSEPVLLKLKYL